MSRFAYVIKERRMAFLQLLGDQPVYALIVQLRNKNSAISLQQPTNFFLVLAYLKYWSQQMWLLQNLSKVCWKDSIFGELSENFSLFLKLFNAGWLKWAFLKKSTYRRNWSNSWWLKGIFPFQVSNNYRVLLRAFGTLLTLLHLLK